MTQETKIVKYAIVASKSATNMNVNRPNISFVFT